MSAQITNELQDEVGAIATERHQDEVAREVFESVPEHLYQGKHRAPEA
jgi:hypothetical protein